MEKDGNSFVHDTIDLKELRMLLNMDSGEDCTSETAADGCAPEEMSVPTDTEAEIPELSDREKERTAGTEAPTEQDGEKQRPSFSPEEDEFLSDLPQNTVEWSESESDSVQISDRQKENGQSVPAEDCVPEAPPREKNENPSEGTDAKKEKGSWVYEIYCMLQDVVYLLAAVTLVFVFLVRLVGVQGSSMFPTLHNNDYLVLESNFLYNGEDLEYGDVVVLNVPYFSQRGEGPIVKRIIATEGQTVDIDFTNGLVFVDGILLQETYINEKTYYNWDGDMAMEYPAKVPDGCVFVLGDNRNESLDSRFAAVGMVKEQYVLGKVLLIALPGQTKTPDGTVTDPRQWGRIGLVS